MRSHLFHVATAALTGLMAAGCGETSTGPAVPPTLSIVSGDHQTGFPGDTLPIPLKVRATSASGNAMAGIPLTWTPLNGTAISPEAVTRADGTASATLVLGLVGGAPDGATVATEAVDGLRGEVTFSATSNNPCNFPVPLTLGTPVSGTIRNRDCSYGDGSYLDVYAFTVSGTAHVSFGMTSSEVDAFLFVKSGTGRTVAKNDSASTTTTDAAIEALVPAGEYRVWANTRFAADYGAYQLTSAALPLDISPCVRAWVAFGVSANQVLPPATCKAPNDALVVADHYLVQVYGGNIVTATMTAAAFAGSVRIFANSAIVASGTASAAGQPASASFTVPGNQDGVLVIQLSSASGGNGGGPYTMSVAGPGQAGSVRASNALGKGTTALIQEGR